MPHSFWWLACDAGAVYRLAILVTKDEIAAPVREWFRRRLPASWPSADMPLLSAKGKRRVAAFTLITCPWCISIWIGAAAVALTHYAPAVWQYAAVALTCSAVAGFLAER